MEFRSTNTVGYVHYQGDVVSNVGSSHGVQLTGGSTGGTVRPIGDDTSITLTLEAKGAGLLNLGQSSATVRIGGAGSSGSTTGISMGQRYLVEWTVPAMSSGSTAAESTITVAGLTTNSLLFVSPRVQVNSTVIGVTLHPRCSTTDELVLQMSKIGESSISGSTQSAYLWQFRF